MRNTSLRAFEEGEEEGGCFPTGELVEKGMELRDWEWERDGVIAFRVLLWGVDKKVGVSFLLLLLLLLLLFGW